MNKKKLLLALIALVIPLFCVVIIVAGTLGYGLISAADGRPLTGAQPDNAKLEADVGAIAAAYAGNNDLDAARASLKALGMPNPGQYLSYMVDQYIQDGRGPTDPEAANLLKLADALGVTTPAMVAALSTPTPLSTPTLPPTNTPLPTSTSLPTDTPPPPTDTPPPPTAAPTDTPPPPDTPTPKPAPAQPKPPTNTPEPTAAPKPQFDFVITQQHMLSQNENGGCRGGHQIFVTVLDKAGNPLNGATVEDTFKAVPSKVTGAEKGAGKVEYDLWKNGFSVAVTKNEDGSPAASQVTDKLSSVDTDIPTEWLLQGGYCSDMNDCTNRKNTNQLCFGHYSYFVTFQKTH